MSSGTYAAVDMSNGPTAKKGKVLAYIAPTAKPLHPKIKGDTMAILSTLGSIIMTWQQVILCISFVAGGVVLGLKDKETLAATVLGAAAGYLAQPFLKSNRKPPSSSSQDTESSQS